MKLFDVMVDWMGWSRGAARGNIFHVRIEKCSTNLSYMVKQKKN